MQEDAYVDKQWKICVLHHIFSNFTFRSSAKKLVAGSYRPQQQWGLLFVVRRSRTWGLPPAYRWFHHLYYILRYTSLKIWTAEGFRGFSYVRLCCQDKPIMFDTALTILDAVPISWWIDEIMSDHSWPEMWPYSRFQNKGLAHTSRRPATLKERDNR